jgi:two-component system, chemotaxis family, chemotaxis protein CheY
MNDPDDFTAQRHLIVGGKPHAVSVLRQVLTILGVRQIQTVAEPLTAIDVLRTRKFTAVLCDESAERCGEEHFAHAARRTPGLVNPLVPIFLVSGGPRRRDVEQARDLGFTDVLTRPVSAAIILKKLRLALRHPRPFIATPDFFGPDRRSQQRANFHGDDRRTRKPRQVKIPAPADDKDFLL